MSSALRARRLESSGVKAMTNALSGHALVVNAQIVGGWKRTLVSHKVIVEPKPLIRLSEAERRAIATAARRLGRYLALQVEIRWL